MLGKAGMLVSQGWGSMNRHKILAISFSFALGLMVLGAFWSNIIGANCGAAEARHRRSSAGGSSHRGHAGAAHAGRSSRHHGRSGGRHGHLASGKRSKKGKAVASAKSKYAYPLDFFMMK